MDNLLSRKDFLISSLLGMAGLAHSQGSPAATQTTNPITVDDLKAYEKLIGIQFSDAERKEILSDVQTALRGHEAIHKIEIPYTVEPALIQSPLGSGTNPDAKVRAKWMKPRDLDPKVMTEEAIAFCSVRELSEMIRRKRITSVRLTEIYLKRLKEYGDKLLNVVTLTEELAMTQARQADADLAKGKYHGPLHGIPYGIKDLFAVPGYPCTWGAAPYKDQQFDYNAAVVEKLNAAGAVCLAKLSMGALAMNDVWFKGKTKNPWNTKRGSSGSSAGSASATAAGLVAFSIGTETYGSIVSPSHECRVTGLRPSYGRVSRFGGMALSWTMDKVGPICREVEDCAVVLAAICGSDPKDPSAVDQDFSWPKKVDPTQIRIGIVSTTKDLAKLREDMKSDRAVQILKELGFQVEPVYIQPMPAGMDVIIDVECASAFDEFTRGQKIKDLKESFWPRIFRAARYVPAVEYVQAQRLRRMHMDTFEANFKEFDVLMGTGIGQTLIETNYTGHPQILIPFGTNEQGLSQSRSFVAKLYQEDLLCSVAKLFQDKAGYHLKFPDLSSI